MAESESGQDKTEDPTDKRKRDAREKGEIARSKELNTVAVTLAGAGGLLAFGGHMAETLLSIMRINFSLTRDIIVDERAMGAFLLASGKMAIWAVQPVLILLFVISFVAPIALSGFLFSGSLLQPKFSRMNPLAGLKRMFSMHGLTELLKALAKFFVILAVAVVVLINDRQALLSIANEPLEQAIIHSLQVVGWSALWMSAGLLLIAAADVPIQLYQTHKKMKMTKQEVRDEYKDSEGKPEVKQRIRQLQREMSQRRMMAAVPQADVIITNPTHYAVALQYDPEKGGAAPLLLAKGTDFMALKIREIGVEHKIQILESPALARAIYYSTEPEQEIPAGLYLAVAQVLAYVFQIRQYRAGRGKRPEPLKEDLPIPPDLRRDS
ncbi:MULTISPECIES: flagellar biosynthesis protein FlhB [Pseudomonas]|jgi:flagellar biosynthetic protein FlhB|uniref:Flagellar biosynthetic protein FlhB n=1 Tax=Pseudomonas putida NBRC 14164 TaxID=1211579 RepID=A0ABN5UI90_PSEPU|nr:MULTISPECIES: flagellar biosynthesis protein FlhB [Pseudomonas]EKT4460795.1 flagellar biosynthesis protein FlhB [Pseudomonas putida]EKT4555049.1 flagellar biosynthesis protein FlhB [Pseudomonas putida]MCI1037144.1 flagellar biosynthesis protein FlhB [Pseudomonas putida]MCX9137366.1 flagellar biosynthesis protein FlhB [Pseudomonas sp. DCB_PUT]MDD1972891.1 flagellar biosynthesis protein FlhB [Pseudomonas putida]